MLPVCFPRIPRMLISFTGLALYKCDSSLTVPHEDAYTSKTNSLQTAVLQDMS